MTALDTVPQTIGCPAAERELLGALLSGTPADTALVLDQLDDTDLVIGAHIVVVAALRRLVEADAPDLGPVAVLGELRRTGEITSTVLGNGDGAAGVLLADLYGSAPVPLGAAYRLRIVQEHTARRRLQQAGMRLSQAAESGALGNVPELVRSEMDAAIAALARIGGRP